MSRVLVKVSRQMYPYDAAERNALIVSHDRTFAAVVQLDDVGDQMMGDSIRDFFWAELNADFVKLLEHADETEWEK